MRVNKNLIFAVTGSFGLISSVYFAIKDTRKNIEALDNLKENGFTKETAVPVVKGYWKTILAGGVTLASIIGSNVVSGLVIAGLTSELNYMRLNRDKIAEKVRKCVPNGDNLVKDAMLENVIVDNDKRKITVEETGNGDVLCFEGYSGRYFRSSLEAVSDALRRFADRFESGEYVNFNDLYKELDIDTTRFGYDWGYAPGSCVYDAIEPFEYEIEDLAAVDHVEGKFKGERIILIDILTPPCECYMDL